MKAPQNMKHDEPAYNMKSRIELTDTMQSALVKMAEGNPGAITAMIEIVKNGDKIDPQSFAGGFGAILMLDTYRIYGSDIYILWSDICQRDTAKTLAVLRACQLGLFSSVTLKEAASRQDRTGKTLVPVEELYKKVREKLTDFDADALIAALNSKQE